LTFCRLLGNSRNSTLIQCCVKCIRVFAKLRFSFKSYALGEHSEKVKFIRQKKRAGTSHSPHPKATCPHPTRPLRPPGRRAHRDYAQVRLSLQPKLRSFFNFSCPK